MIILKDSGINKQLNQRVNKKFPDFLTSKEFIILNLKLFEQAPPFEGTIGHYRKSFYVDHLIQGLNQTIGLLSPLKTYHFNMLRG